jgi:hypothetical protein
MSVARDVPSARESDTREQLLSFDKSVWATISSILSV